MTRYMSRADIQYKSNRGWAALEFAEALRGCLGPQCPRSFIGRILFIFLVASGVALVAPCRDYTLRRTVLPMSLLSRQLRLKVQ